MKKMTVLSLIAANAINLLAASVVDSNTTKLDSLSILGDDNTFPVTVVRDATITQTIINEDALKRSMGAGGSNIFKAVELAPSVNVQTDDPYGFTGGTIRVRGFTEREIGFSLDGVPLNDSGNFAVYAHEYTDAENLTSVALTRGSTKSSAPFYSDIGGSIELMTKYPSKDFQVEISENFGSFNMQRGFYRIDSGELSTGTKVFASYSHTKADKWKGEGQAPDFRKHLALGVTQKFGDVIAEIFYDYNDQLNYAYKYNQMNWTKAQDFETYYKDDYSTNPIDGDYFKLNTNPYTNHVIRARLFIPISDTMSIDVKPYMWMGKGGGYYSYGAPSNITYNNSLNYTTRPGVVAKLNVELEETKIEAGMWYEYADLRNFSKSYAGTNGNDILANLNGSFNYWRYIQETATTTMAPFVSVEKKNIANILDVTAGLKYAMVNRDLTSYDTGDVTSDYSDDDVFNNLGAVNPARTYDQSYAMLLPRLQIGLNLDSPWYPYFSYARTFKVPNNSQGGDQDASVITANLDPEVADGFNLAARYVNEDFFLTPGIFYTMFKDKIITTEISQGVSVPQNVGETSSYGFELEAGKRLMKNIMLYASYGYTKATYEKDYEARGTLIDVTGNQLVDTPEHTVSASVGYDKKDFSAILTAKYISSRFGDATNTQKVAGYTLFNVDIKKEITLMDMKFAGYLSVNNIFDTKYIGKINTGDTKANYYAGVPLAASVGLNAKF
ncbi:TonB-dependent receptor [Sulfurimonas sp. MAG313]|nr:TonB-dependent receptor [Sulfurimonas sp. MAG313]MDF1880177.1 TonB-dependent receptor [Sulfurimonas sp. MAG313]